MMGHGASTKSPGRPGLRRPGGKRGSIREVRLVGLAAVEGWSPGDRVGWWGRSYEVQSAEQPGDRRAVAEEPGSPRYLHLRPVGESDEGIMGRPVGNAVS